MSTDAAFREVADLLYGGGADELIRKMNPDGADISAKKDRSRRRLTAGLSAVGATAGAAGLGYAAHKTGGAYRAARVGVKGVKAAKGVKPVKGVAPMGRKEAAKHAIKEEKLGAALVPLEVAGLGGEIMATHILHGDTKKKIKKSIIEIPENASFPTNKRELTQAAIPTAAKAAGKGAQYTKKKLKRLPDKVETTNVKKSLRPLNSHDDLDLRWQGEISKIDADKQQVFGWASIVEMNGEPVVDLQGDYITIDEVEKSAYDYVHKSRKGGDMHLRDNFGGPVSKSHMIESFVVTPEKKQSLGLPESTPTGWWVGYQVNDPELWSKVKNGERTGFSIHGRGVRE